MPTPCREQIIEAVVSSLRSIAMAELTVERDRAAPVHDEDCPKIVVSEGDEALEILFTGEDCYRLAIEVEAYASGQTAGATLGALRAECDRVLLAQPPLGGLARDLQVSDEPKDPLLSYKQSVPGKAFVRTYALIYATAEGDPYVFA